ncbi:MULTISPECIES: hypothetical protein [unclassified Sphingopyxis]|uniref:hypothetical protein n=1 Tax=unclassified Sphingopyxis TaxID=2614943 RepID=UPI002860B6D2|nr:MULTISPECIES: hypothetical protein [unclassified Sphingopyxis]MDR6834394.1 hypothetical protein [Sphingopyxis sp. BE122]MDR7226663.1 hypothetical protein [Sphingopyxis sp. BE259]
MARFSAATAFMLLSTLATAGHAKDRAPAFDGASVNVVLAGHITAKCSVGGGTTISLGELAADKQATARFDVGCNVPFEMVFRSASGGIAHATQPQGEGPYVGLVPYRLGVTVPALSPSPTQLHADFTSNQMIAGAALNSGDAIAAGGGEIRLQTEMVQGRDLLAGQYVDSITIVINPRV